MYVYKTIDLIVTTLSSHYTVNNGVVSVKNSLAYSYPTALLINTIPVAILENGRSTPGCLTVQSAIRPSVLRRLFAYW